MRPLPLAALLLLSAMPHAHASEDGGAYGVAPNTVDFGQVLREEEVLASLRVQNWKDAPARVTISANDGQPWVHGDPATFEIPARTKIETIVRLRVPADAPNGPHGGSVYVSVSPANEPSRSGSSAQVELAVRVNWTAQVGGVEIARAEAGGLWAPLVEEGDPLAASIGIRNTGNVRVSPEIHVRLRDAAGEPVHEQRVEVEEITAGAFQNVTLPLAARLVPGAYSLEAAVRVRGELMHEEQAWIEVVEKGQLRKRGEMGAPRTIDASTREDAHRLSAGRAFEIRAPFSNTGETTVLARLTGTLFQEGRVVAPLASKEVQVDPGERVDLVALHDGLETPGRYVFVGAVEFSGKTTPQREVVITVEGAPARSDTPGTGLWAILAALSAAAVARRPPRGGATPRTSRRRPLRDRAHLQTLEALIVALVMLTATATVVIQARPTASPAAVSDGLRTAASDALDVLVAPERGLVESQLPGLVACRLEPDSQPCLGARAVVEAEAARLLPAGAVVSLGLHNGAARRALLSAAEAEGERVGADALVQPSWAHVLVLPDLSCREAGAPLGAWALPVRGGRPLAAAALAAQAGGQDAIATPLPSGLWRVEGASNVSGPATFSVATAGSAPVPGEAPVEACDLGGAGAALAAALANVSLAPSRLQAWPGAEVALAYDLAAFGSVANVTLREASVDVGTPAPRGAGASLPALETRLPLAGTAGETSWRVPADALHGLHPLVLRISLSVETAAGPVPVEARVLQRLDVGVSASAMPVQPLYNLGLSAWFPEWSA